MDASVNQLRTQRKKALCLQRSKPLRMRAMTRS